MYLLGIDTSFFNNELLIDTVKSSHFKSLKDKERINIPFLGPQTLKLDITDGKRKVVRFPNFNGLTIDALISDENGLPSFFPNQEMVGLNSPGSSYEYKGNIYRTYDFNETLFGSVSFIVNNISSYVLPIEFEIRDHKLNAITNTPQSLSTNGITEIEFDIELSEFEESFDEIENIVIFNELYDNETKRVRRKIGPVGCGEDYYIQPYSLIISDTFGLTKELDVPAILINRPNCPIN